MIIVIVIAPFIVNIFMSFSTPITVDDDWLGFLGNYSGAIIGGLVAFFIAFYQIEKQKTINEQDDKERNRSYIIAQEFIGPIDLKGIETGDNSRIILNNYYDDYKEDIKSNHPESDMWIPYYRISHRGLPEIILDCEIVVNLSENDDGIPYEITSNIGVLEKNTDVFVPLLKMGLTEVFHQKLHISYTTIKGERMHYVLDIENKKEMCYVLDNNAKIHECYTFNLKTSNWIYPNTNKKVTF